MSENKLKVLCLHGCRQDGKIFNHKTGHFRKYLKQYAEFVYISAPHSIKSFEENDDYDYRSWWYTSPNKDYSSKATSDNNEGFHESVIFVEKFIKENGPFDGLLGFSQGAAFVGLLCFLMQRKEINIDIKFAVMVSGFKSLCTPHLKLYEGKIDIQSLHIIGDSDEIITKDRSEELMRMFENAKVIQHPGAHYVPVLNEMKEQYKQFFKELSSLKQLSNISLTS